MSETQVEAKAKKSETVYTEVTMEDQRKVQFAGKRKMQKEAWFDPEKGLAGVRFDFLNGKTLSIDTSALAREVVLRAAAHGLSQKCGDNVAGVTEVDDMVVGVEEMIEQLNGGAWAAQREAGDSVAGTSIVVRAVAQVLGKTPEAIKTFIQGKLDGAKARGEKLSRQELYNGFRVHPKIGPVIKAMEEEKLAKASSVNADDLLAEAAAA